MSSNIVANVTISGNLYVPVQATIIGKDIYVAVSQGNSLVTRSTDGVNWDGNYVLPANIQWNSVTYNYKTGRFVTVAGNPSTTAAYSDDGVSWSASTMPSSQMWWSVTVNPNTGRYVAVPLYNPSSTATNAAAYSDNGSTWTASTLPSSSNWQCVGVNPISGRFVATGAGTTGAYSDNGSTWTAVTLPFGARSITCNTSTGRFVIMAGGTAAAYSDDGINWNSVTLPVSGSWYGLTVNPKTGRFIAVSQNSANSVYSDNGSSWSIGGSLPSIQYWFSAAVNPNTGRFVVVNNFGYPNAAYSDNGSTWLAMSVSAGASYYSIAAGYTTTTVNSGKVGLGISAPSYQLDMSTDGARKLLTTTWTTGSDERIKKDIESANLQMCYDTVKSIDLKYFKWNFPEGVVPDDKHSLGFIAQDVKEIFPNAVSESNSYGYSDFLSLNTDQILKAMHGALKKVIERKEALQTRIASALASL